MIIHAVQQFGVEPRTVFTLLIGAMFTLSYLSAMDTQELELFLAESVRRTLHFANISEKEAAEAMRLDESLLRKCLRGERELSLTKMIRLPYRFWPIFGPILMFVVAQKRFDEIASSFGMEADRVRAQAVFDTIPTRRATHEPPVDTRLRA